MSERIEASLKVLNHIRRLRKDDPHGSARSWRLKATELVASSREVTTNTIFAHLVGKNTVHTRKGSQIDQMVTDWVNSGSPALKNWILKSCDADDEVKVVQFFANK